MATVENRVSVLIDSFFNNKGFNDAIKSGRDMKKVFDDLGRAPPLAKILGSDQFKGGKDIFSDLQKNANLGRELRVQEAFVNKFGLSLSNLAEAASKNPKEFAALQKSLGTGGFEDFMAGIRSSKKELQKFGFSGSEVQRQFRLEFLGIMFFGMALQRAFEGLAKTTVSSFMRITEGMTPAAQAVNALTANFELLKFSIGEAIAGVLEALLPVIIPIIMGITDWIQQNQKLAGWIIIIGAILGALLFIVGQLSLGVIATLQVWDLLVASFGSTEAAALAVKNFFTGLGTTLLWVGGIILLLWLLWETNFGNIQEFTSGTLGILFELFKTVFKGIWDIIKMFFQIVKNIFKGDWKAVWEITKLAGSKLFELLLKVLVGLAQIVWNILSFIVNLFKDAFFSIIKLIVFLGGKWVDAMLEVGRFIANAISEPIQKATDFIANLLQKIANGLSRLGFSGAAKKVQGFADALKNLDTNQVINQTIDNLKALNQTKVDSANADLSKLQETLSLGFFDKQDFDNWSQAIEENNKFTKSIKEQGDSNDFFGINVDSMTAANDVFDSIGSKIENVRSASDSLAASNIAEAESWDLKTEAATNYADQMERIQQLQASTQNQSLSGNSDLDRALANFVTTGVN